MRNLPTPEPAGGDSRPALPLLPGCGRPAVAQFELYSPRASVYGSLDGDLYVCEEHADHDLLRQASGLTPYQLPAPRAEGKRCGEGWDFLAMHAIAAPEVPAGDDADLLALFPKGGHPVIDAAETAVRRAAELHGQHLTRQGAEAVLATLDGLAALTERERAGLLARFARESVCGTCGAAVEFIATPTLGSPFYRHVDRALNDGSHIARPAVTQ